MLSRDFLKNNEKENQSRTTGCCRPSHRTFTKDKSVSGRGVTRQADGRHLRKRHPGAPRFAGRWSVWFFRVRRHVDCRFDDLEFSGALTRPSLTTIRIDAEQVGIRTAEYVCTGSPGCRSPSSTTIPTSLIGSREYSAYGQTAALALPSNDATFH
jgi:hypothetical protein